VHQVGQSHVAIKPFVGIVVTETDLQLDCLFELSLLAVLQHFPDGLLQELRVNLAHPIKYYIN
jgi:hypothetical protein